MVLQPGPVPGALGRYAPTLHLDAHTRSLRDCGLTGKRDATRPFLPRSVHLVMLHQGCRSIEATEFERLPWGKHRAPQEVTESIWVVLSTYSATSDSPGNKQLVRTSGLDPVLSTDFYPVPSTVPDAKKALDKYIYIIF